MTVRIYLDEAAGEWVAEAPLSGLSARARPEPSLGPNKSWAAHDHYGAQAKATRALVGALCEAACVPDPDPAAWKGGSAYYARVSRGGHVFRADGSGGETFGFASAWARLVEHLDPISARHVGQGGVR